MQIKNMLFKFDTGDSVQNIALKTIQSITVKHDGLLQIKTKENVIFTISLYNNLIPLVQEYYNDYLWEKTDSIKSITFKCFSVISRLDLD